MISGPEDQVAQKICCNSASEQQQSSGLVSNKTRIFWYSCKVTDSDIKALRFSNLSIKIGYILLKHPVQSMKIGDPFQ